MTRIYSLCSKPLVKEEPLIIPCEAKEVQMFEVEAEEFIETYSEKLQKKWGLQVPKSTRKRVETLSEPILMKNRLVGLENCKNESEKLKFDLNLRPSEPTEQNYSNIPVSEFGAAMLRGMGWKGPTDLKSKDDESVNKPRPERLGLGASEVKDLNELKKRKPIEQSLGLEMTKEETRKLELLDLKKKRSDQAYENDFNSKKMKLEQVNIGTRVFIAEGEHSGLNGIVKSESKNQAHWIIELAINHQDVRVPKHQVKRYDKMSMSDLKDIKEMSVSQSDALLWVCAGLKVKIKSKSFLDGRYYNRKGVILDVRNDQTCTIKLYEGHQEIVQKVPQKCLETCLPRAADPSRPTVKYLKNDKGSEYFQGPFRVLQFDDERGRAVVQSDDNFEVVFEAHYDDICEFVP